MKKNRSQYVASLRFVLGVALVGCLFATTTRAQSRFEGTFKLTNEVHWRAAVLPFPGKGGGSKHCNTRAERIKHAVRTHTGLVWNLHLFRHLSAKN